MQSLLGSSFWFVVGNQEGARRSNKLSKYFTKLVCFCNLTQVVNRKSIEDSSI